jgi:hypothetical protein
MSSSNEKRAKKIMAIALDMHQPKEIRIQAVRVLKVMHAVEELWVVAQNVKCPFTRQSAIDSIPALEARPQKDSTFVPAKIEVKEEPASATIHVNISTNKLEWP